MRPVTRITDPTDFDDAFADEVEKLVLDRFSGAFPDVFLEVAVEKFSDYYQVTVFLTDSHIIDRAVALASELSDELADSRHYVFIYAKSWDRAA